MQQVRVGRSLKANGGVGNLVGGNGKLKREDLAFDPCHGE